MYKEMDSPSYKLVNRQVSPEEKQRGIVLQNRVYRNEPLTAHEQAELTSITDRFGGVAVKEFANVDEARKFYLGMSQEKRLRHSIMPVNNPTQLQEKINTLQNVRDAQADAAYVVPERVPSKYHKFQLPGGENYREILLTLPNKPMEASKAAENYYTQFVKRGGEPEWAQLNSVRQQEITNAMPAQARNASAAPEYRSSHFDEPNILAHMRVNDRIDADGKKMLLIEEVQSDWHQAGREKGYNTPEKRAAEQKKLNDLLVERQQLGERQKQLEELASPYTSQGKDAPRDILDEWNSVSNRLNRLQTEQNRLGRSTGEGVPDAPFKDTWHQLALKRALKEAVDKGYDRIGLTTGAQQAERYNLAKQVDEVIAKRNPDGSFNLDATLVGGGSQQSIGKNIASDKLADYVGKDLAQTMQSQSAGTDVYSGDALKVGGEGMKKYYDEIYPAFLNKQGKKYGAQVGETQIPTDRSTIDGMPSMYQNKETVRYLDITPEMRKAIQEGQPIASIQNELAKALA
jgi:hypothetical protein